MVEAAAALIWDKNKFMICQRPSHKARGLLWEFVGGKVEPGEIPQYEFCPADEGILREICRKSEKLHIISGQSKWEQYNKRNIALN